MQEGDIVYYESARCLHGRMKPLMGEFYVNIFAHYRYAPHRILTTKSLVHKNGVQLYPFTHFSPLTDIIIMCFI
jgi:hypothetical protein